MKQQTREKDQPTNELEALRKSQHLHQLILENAHDLITVHKPDDLSFEYINHATLKVLGYSKKELMGKSSTDFIHPDDLERVLNTINENLEKGEVSAEFRYRKKDGSYVWLEANAALMPDESENSSLIVISRDITDRKRLEEALHTEQTRIEQALSDSEDNYRTVFENTGTAIIIVDKDLRILRGNSAFEELSGYSQDELVGRSPFEFVIPEDLANVQENYRLRKLDPAKAPQNYEIKCIDKHGRIRDCIIYVSLVHDSEYVVVSLLDVSAQHQAEALTKASEERFRALFEKAPVAIAISRNDRIILANQAYVTMFGYDSTMELQRIQVTTQVAPASRREVENLIKKREKVEALSSSHETIGQRKNGTTFPLFVQVDNILLPDGPANVAFFTDITAQKQAEAAMKQQVKAKAVLLKIIKQFNSVMVSDIDYAINMTLQEIGEFNNAARCYLVLFSEDGSKVSVTREWCAAGIRPAIHALQNQPVDSFPYTLGKLQRLEHVYISVNDLPPAAEQEKKSLHLKSTQSLLLVPITHNCKLIGFFGFDSTSNNIARSEERINMLDLVAQTFTTVLQRKKHILDIQESENYYRAIFENTGAPTMIIEENMTISLANQEWERLLGYKKEELVGTQMTELFGSDVLGMMKKYHRLLRIDPKSVPSQYMTCLRDHDGNLREGLFCVDIIPGTTKSVASFIDMTEHMRIERALKVTSANNIAMLKACDEQDFLRNVCRQIIKIGKYRMVWVGYTEKDERQTVLPVAHAGYETGYLEKLDISLADPQRVSGPVSMSIQTGQPFICQNIMTDPKFIPWRKEALSRGYKSMITIPLQANGGVNFGTISIYSADLNIFDTEEIKLLTEMAADLAYGIMSLRARSERDMSMQELEKSLEKMQRILMQVVTSLGSTLEIRDPYTAGHQIKVSKLATAIAEEMGFSKEQIEGVAVAGNLHDIGKINVPSEILSKPGKITDIEFSIIKTHCQAGYEIIKDIEFPWPVAEIMLQHHERMDGSGYPRGLTGGEILMEARVLAVADVVEAMSSHRPYRPSLGIDLALEEISQKKGILYDPDVVDICLRLFREKGFELK
jgi:PAS domain S-box-containing protein/putative nucleotidyltransferase with HDIG domain